MSSNKIHISLSVPKEIEVAINNVAKNYNNSKNAVINIILEKFVESGADLNTFLNTNQNKNNWGEDSLNLNGFYDDKNIRDIAYEK